MKIKKTILLIHLLIIAYSSFSQNIDYIEKYHKIILKAESMLLNKKYDSSLYYYQTAFSNVPYSFASDYKNAAFASYKSNNLNLAQSYIDSAAIRGIPLKKSFKKYFYNNKEWVDFSTDKYYQLKSRGTLKKDLLMIKLIDSLYIEDQNARHSEKYDLAWEIKCRRADSLIAECLMPFLLKGKICEETLSWSTYLKFSIISFHFLLENKFIINKLYKDGKIWKSDYFYCITRPTQWGEKTEFLYPEMLKKFHEKLNTASIDINRKKFGIPSVEETIQLNTLRNKSSGLFFFNLKWY